ncbi:MAG: hypothetical protein EOP84_27500 [Verrucomicrobiaceae bacterium]|uniref:imm11 family protein n=1 Tax=Corallococcus coralloides TaxID=184914 RepID=UPI000FFEC572|nr:DUF1629 domain-containing protein [Corallococcus coralloides]RYD69960.1 MAG: hypothetical protein EOP84_27500 [Verrucomicrobiaceae bacterium]
MERRFFSLTIDVYIKGRWYLGDPTDTQGKEIDDIWQFRRGRPIELREKLCIPVYRSGAPLDVDFAGVGLTPIVGARAASVFREMASDDVQLFPVEVVGEARPYHLLNVQHEIRCVDDAACRSVQHFTDDDVMPEKAGQYRSVIGLRIDKSKVGSARVFRLWGYSIPIIVDGEIKDALEASGTMGGKFEEV